MPTAVGLQHWAFGRFLTGWPLRAITVLAFAAGMLVATGTGHLPVAKAAGQPPLLPAAGQFVSVTPAYALNTVTGLGESSAQPLAAGATIKFSVTGSDGVPSGAQSVAVDIFADQPAASGFLTAYDPDWGDPGVASVGLASGLNSEQTDTVQVSVGGMIAITNHSTGSTDLKVAISGYFTGSNASSAADTYTGLSWTKIVDTTTGLGTVQSPIAAGGAITVQVTGNGGVPAGADAAFVQVNAFDATTSGYLDVYPAGTSDHGVSSLRYRSNDTYRNLVYAPLSSSGQVTTYQRTEAADLTTTATTLNQNPGNPPGPTPAPAAFGTASGSMSATRVNRAGAAEWAVDHWDGSNNGFFPDCTDFVSRALSRGGGDPESPGDSGPGDAHWFYVRNFEWSASWPLAFNLADHHAFYVNSYFLPYWNSGVHVGDVIWANFSGGSFSTIDHTGIVSAVSNGIPLIAQHSTDRKYESIIRWFHRGHPTNVWLAIPNPY